MKICLLNLAMLIGFAPIASAQVATDQNLPAEPEQSATPAISSPTPPKVPERAQIDEIFKETSLGKEADERRLHIEWRQLQNQFANDRDILAAKHAADTARTDYEKRERLRDYYELYYGRMRVMARSAEMKTALDRLKTTHLSQLTQARVRHETDSELPTPSATPKKKKGNKRLDKFRKGGA
ncbi:MAG TPA: hypothetical protein VH170_05820 [Chthoniobacterales bacterium]|jgi:hypothetical protein|nr:hypothetical protein [Chthoniobacterales bacterium]